MQFWQSLIFAESDQLLDLARTAEAVGFTGVVLPDHVAMPEQTSSSYPYSEYELDPKAPFLDPWPTIAAMSAVTTRLLFSTYVYILPMRDPFSVAKSLATTAILSRGRVSLGLGVGWLREEVEILGHAFEARGARCDEMIDVMRALWTQGSAEYHGRHFDFPRVFSEPTPDVPIPVYVGGHTRAAIERAARCDGWMGLDFELAEVPDVVEKIRDARRRVGRASEPFEIFLSPRDPVETDTYRRLEEMGVTAVIVPSWALLEGDFERLDAKQQQMERFAATYF